VADAGHNTEERHAIAEQPTELFDIEAEIGTEDAPASEIQASRAATPEVEDEEEEDDEFWSDQRLSDELDQALEAPLADERRDEAEQPEDEKPRTDYDPDTGHEDVLEDTPEFLEESPEDDDLWFEQRPPKDFDFDD
jgi:hypothetical protein